MLNLLHHSLCLNQQLQPTSKQQSATDHQEREKKMLQLICLRKNLSIYLFHLLYSKRLISFFFRNLINTRIYVRRRIQLNIKCSTFEIIRKYEWHNCNFIVVLKIEMKQIIAWSQIENYTDQKYNVFLSIWWLNFFFKSSSYFIKIF